MCFVKCVKQSVCDGFVCMAQVIHTPVDVRMNGVYLE